MFFYRSEFVQRCIKKMEHTRQEQRPTDKAVLSFSRPRLIDDKWNIHKLDLGLWITQFPHCKLLGLVKLTFLMSRFNLYKIRIKAPGSDLGNFSFKESGVWAAPVRLGFLRPRFKDGYVGRTLGSQRYGSIGTEYLQEDEHVLVDQDPQKQCTHYPHVINLWKKPAIVENKLYKNGRASTWARPVFTRRSGVIEELMRSAESRVQSVQMFYSLR